MTKTNLHRLLEWLEKKLSNDTWIDTTINITFKHVSRVNHSYVIHKITSLFIKYEKSVNIKFE